MKRLLFPLSTLLLASTAHAQTASMQSPAYQECTALAASNPAQALAKADAWLKIDTGVAAQHCRAMALFGLHRFAEAGDALSAVRDSIPTDNVTLRAYVTRQAAQSFLNANSADKALLVLNSQITEIGNVRSDNANAAKQTSSLLLDRARLNITYGRLDEASKDLDHAVSLTPVNEEVLIERAGVFEKLGDVPLARNDLDAVLTINPNNNVAKNARARLSGKAAAGSTQLVMPATAAAAEAAYAPTPVQAAPVSVTAPQAVPVAAATPAATATPVVDTAVTPVSSANLPAQATPQPMSAPATAAVAPVASPFTPPTVDVQQPAPLPSVHKPKKKAAKKIASAPAVAAAPVAPIASKPVLPLPSPHAP